MDVLNTKGKGVGIKDDLIIKTKGPFLVKVVPCVIHKVISTLILRVVQ